MRHTVAMSRPVRRRKMRLRTRVTLFFSLTALVASLALAVVTYALARSFLTSQRNSVARTQAFNNANALKTSLLLNPTDIGTQVRDLRTEGAAFLLVETDASPREYFTDQGFLETAFPVDLRTMVAERQSGLQHFSRDGEPYVAVGVYIRAADAQYFEAFSLADTNRTLRYLATALAIGAGVTTLFAAGLGWSTSRRLLRPLSRVSEAAGEIASGGLDTRMAPESDPDLALLASSFNEMADAVQTRIEREVRFASDVSHELRSPITALAAAVEVLDARRADLPDRSQQALDVVVGQVRRFDQMVMDLLELSRIDAGSTELHREPVDLTELISRITHRYGFGDTPIDVDTRLPSTARVDKLRFERILANLLENAQEHGGGPTRISAAPYGRHGMVLAVSDTGPGVARSERVRIFERFARGSAARHRIGTGLGLALVAEHAQAHGGEAWVEDRAGGGAQFKVTFGDISE
ncbi:MAG: mtrB [Ilumatobacteraceae bacterium]|nr:mtrB [Ilumatobacteraceae bacterium]